MCQALGLAPGVKCEFHDAQLRQEERGTGNFHFAMSIPSRERTTFCRGTEKGVLV